MDHEEKKDSVRFGWLCSYTPVEILVAAGLAPVRLDAGNLLLQKPNPNIYQLICPYIRAVFDAGQEKAFGPLDGAVFVKCCDGMIRLYDLWKAHLPQQRSYILPLPKTQSREAATYFAQTMKRLAETLENDLGRPVTVEALRKAIAEGNRLRSSVQKIYQTRLQNPQSMTYSKLRSLIREWLSVPPDQALVSVEAELRVFEEKPSKSTEPEAKVLIASSTLDQLEIIEIIEKAGMTVVADDHCSGLRHFDALVLEEGDPYLNLAERYLKRWPCARMQADPSHIERMIQEVDATGANGVIWVGLKYCDQAGYDMPRIQSRLKERHIPFLYIENDYTASGLSQLRVRIEAFSEMLKEEF
ncbi:MAG: 2-hydroxyacyl-CoA dehydratase family protein [Pseudomonadota bacterium]